MLVKDIDKFIVTNLNFVKMEYINSHLSLYLNNGTLEKDLPILYDYLSRDKLLFAFWSKSRSGEKITQAWDQLTKTKNIFRIFLYTIVFNPFDKWKLNDIDFWSLDIRSQVIVVQKIINYTSPIMSKLNVKYSKLLKNYMNDKIKKLVITYNSESNSNYWRENDLDIYGFLGRDLGVRKEIITYLEKINPEIKYRTFSTKLDTILPHLRLESINTTNEIISYVDPFSIAVIQKNNLYLTCNFRVYNERPELVKLHICFNNRLSYLEKLIDAIDLFIQCYELNYIRLNRYINNIKFPGYFAHSPCPKGQKLLCSTIMKHNRPMANIVIYPKGDTLYQQRENIDKITSIFLDYFNQNWNEVIKLGADKPLDFNQPVLDIKDKWLFQFTEKGSGDSKLGCQEIILGNANRVDKKYCRGLPIIQPKDIGPYGSFKKCFIDSEYKRREWGIPSDIQINSEGKVDCNDENAIRIREKYGAKYCTKHLDGYRGKYLDGSCIRNKGGELKKYCVDDLCFY